MAGPILATARWSRLARSGTVGMMTAMVKARADLLPVVVGAVTALVVAHLFGPAPAIITAGLAGAAAAALVHREAA